MFNVPKGIASFLANKQAPIEPKAGIEAQADDASAPKPKRKPKKQKKQVTDLQEMAAQEMPAQQESFSDDLSDEDYFAPFPTMWEDVQAVYAPNDFYTGRIRRVRFGNGRRIYENEGGERFLSVTSFISETMRKPKELEYWRDQHLASLGVEETDSYVEQTASYGSALHILIADFARAGKFSMIDLRERVEALLEGQGFNPKAETFEGMCRDCISDFACFAHFLYAYQVEVVAIELPIFSSSMKLATQIDLVCKLTHNGKRKLAIVDWKTGRSSAKYSSHAMQLALEAHMFEGAFGAEHGKVEVLLNVTPKKWRTSPSCNVINHTATYGEHVALAKGLQQAYMLSPSNNIFNFEKTELKMSVKDLAFGQDPSLFFKKVKN